MKCGHIIQGATCPLGTCYPLGKSHWAQQPLEFRAIIIFCKKKRKITAKNEQVKKCLKARRLLQNKSSFHNVHPPNREGSNRLGARGGRSHPIIDSINISAGMGIGLTRA